MLHFGAQPAPPEVEVLEPGPTDTPPPMPPDVDVDVTVGPVVGLAVVVVGPVRDPPPKPPAPRPCSVFPDAQAAKSPALQKAITIKVELACFTGVW